MNDTCDFCGYDMKEAMQRFKERGKSDQEEGTEEESTTIISYQPVKEEQTKTTKYVSPIKTEGQKIRKAPNKNLVWAFRILIFISIAGFIVSTIMMFSSELGGQLCEISLIGFLLFAGLTVLLLIPVWILESLTRSEGRSLCYAERRRQKTDCEECMECFDCCPGTACTSMSFAFSLITLMFSRR
jgi:hypothetical protein